MFKTFTSKAQHGHTKLPSELTYTKIINKFVSIGTILTSMYQRHYYLGCINEGEGRKEIGVFVT